MLDIHTQDQYIDISDGVVFVRSWTSEASKSNIPVILMHDSLGSVELWRDFPRELAQLLSRPIIAYDRLGFGRSTAREKLPALSFVRDEANTYFPQVVQALGLDEFIPLGHSVGGGMSLLIAASHMKSCKAVVSISAQSFVEQRTVDGVRAAKESFRDLKQFERLKKWHGDKAKWVLDAWTELWLAPEMFAWSLEPEIGHIECPVLAIHGKDDEYGSVAFPKLIIEKVSGAKSLAILSDCGHMPHREKKEKVLRLIQEFLSTI
jgi:pimeloyl-ACP methyl ester carboxylesterase